MLHIKIKDTESRPILNKMLCSIFFIAVVASGVQGALKPSEYGDKIQQLVEVLHTACVLRSGVDEDSIAGVINGQFVDEPKIKAYMKCLFLDSGVVDEVGDFQMDVLAELVPAKILDEMVKDTKICDTKAKGISDIGDRVFAFLKCFYDLNPDIFIFF